MTDSRGVTTCAEGAHRSPNGSSAPEAVGASSSPRWSPSRSRGVSDAGDDDRIVAESVGRSCEAAGRRTRRRGDAVAARIPSPSGDQTISTSSFPRPTRPRMTRSMHAASTVSRGGSAMIGATTASRPSAAGVAATNEAPAASVVAWPQRSRPRPECETGGADCLGGFRLVRLRTGLQRPVLAARHRGRRDHRGNP